MRENTSEREKIRHITGLISKVREKKSTRLRLSDFNLEVVPPEILELTNLEALDLSNNLLKRLPPGISKLAALDTLDLSNNQLTTLPPEICKLTGLRRLILAGNQLQALPLEISALNSLNILVLSHNQIKTLPASISNLASIQFIAIGNNGLSEIPPEILEIESLAILHLDGNEIKSLPSTMTRMTSLQLLSLRENGLRSLPSEIFKLTGLQALDLEGNEIEEIPPEIGQLASLIQFLAVRNKIAHLPPEIARLKDLEVLDLEDNQIANLPSEIGELTSLERLYLEYNQLESLPADIGRLNNLEVLVLRGNRLTNLPPEFANLKGIERLDLGGNQFTSLPACISNLQNLEILALSKNALATLPPEIANLKALKDLDLSDNQLSALPTEIAELPALEEIFLDGNPLPAAYFRALEDDISNLLALLRSLSGETEPLYEAKLVITGEGQVGKSWTLAALRGKDPSAEVGVGNTTWGIDRGDLRFPHPAEVDREIQLNTWDFGGQAVYRVTHQFFFSEQAIYLLVWNPRKGPVQCRVREWLRTIALRTGSEVSRGKEGVEAPGPHARVIMVATHAEEPGGAYNPEYGFESLEADLQAMIVAHIEIDSYTGYNIKELRRIVARCAAELPDMGNPFNARWADAREAVLALRNKHAWISFERFSGICNELGITDVRDQRTIVGTFMHRLGRAVWYGPSAGTSAGSADALLADTLVLDAVWLSRAFVQILEDSPTRESGGMLDHRRFPLIWTEHERPEWYKYSPDEYERLARMMRRFDVALPTRASHGQRSLVPQLVPAIPPSTPWTTPEESKGKRLVRLACHLNYEAEGLIPRLIAATEPYHVYSGNRGLFWQEGVFLRDTSSFNNDALVTVRGTEAPLVSIVVSGDQPGFLMNELYQTLESVLSFWKGMTRTYYILCPTKAAQRYCGGRFKFDTVQRRSRSDDGRNLDCQDCDAVWTPEQLLHGLEAVRDRRLAEHQIDYLFHKDTLPCPRTFLLRPADPRWHKVTSWASFVGKRFEITLVSELSGKAVESAEFSVRKEWTKWLGPLTRIASLALTGLAVPLDGEIAQQLADGAATMEKLGSLPPEGEATSQLESARDARHALEPLFVTNAQLHQLNQLLREIHLDPRSNGMELAETRDGRWLWMTVEEAEAHSRPDARVQSDA